MKSTSIHGVNADKGLGLFGKVGWFLFNYINNLLAHSKLDESLEIVNFQSDETINDFQGFSETVSPARVLCNLFWQDKLQQFERELGGKIKALEVGCGSGVYGTLLNDILDNRVDYKGVDIAVNSAWDDFSDKANYHFSKADSADISHFLEDVNLVFTQSALEHFEQDMIFFEQIAEYVETIKEPFIQVHLIPAQGSINTFPWHGIRQYTPRNVSKITKLFPGAIEKTLYKLGSSRCNELHRKWITIPGLLRKKDPRQGDVDGYQKSVNKAIKDDMLNPTKDVSFYALVIKSLP